jgi:hypothetical protein
VISNIQDLSRSYAPEVVANQKLTAPAQTFAEALTEESSTSNSQVSDTTGVSGQFFGGWTAVTTSQHAPVTTPFDPQPAAPAAPPETQTPAAPSAPFVPQFLDNVRVLSEFGDSWPLNPAGFATQQTAQYIADKFGTGQIVQVPFGGSDGPYEATAEEYHIVLPNGKTVNAGLLADYYVRMPETKFPGLADIMIQVAVAKAEQFNS